MVAQIILVVSVHCLTCVCGRRASFLGLPQFYSSVCAEAEEPSSGSFHEHKF